MSQSPLNVLFILRFPPSVQQEYLQGTAAAVPEAVLNMVTSVDEADPYLPDANVIVTFGPMLGGRSEHVFGAAPNLKWVQSMGTGVDNIVDVPTLREDVIVTKMHGIHGPPVSEAAITSMLSLGRDVPHYIRSQEARSWTRPRPPELLYEKTAGIFGIGAIAEALALRLKALGMRVIGITSAPREVEGFDAIYPRSEILQALAELDHLVILTPLTEETRNAIGGKELAAMKSTAYLTNLARGGVVDEKALLDALREKRIAGAALDVFVTEPLPSDHPFWEMDNVIVTPHVGGFNDGYAKAALPILTENMRLFLAGKRDEMINIVER